LREVHSRMPAPVWGISWTDRTRYRQEKRICCGIIWPLAHVTLGECLSLVWFNCMVQSLGRRVEAFKTLPVEPPPILLVDGMRVKIASPNGDMGVDAQGRYRTVKRRRNASCSGSWGYGPIDILWLCYLNALIERLDSEVD
jgi:hypothetical protein